MDNNYIIKKVESVDSTNDKLEKYAYNNDEKKDVLLIAKSQNKGKGRFDRTFYSPKDTGLYMSFLHYYDDVFDIEDITIKVGIVIKDILKDKYNIDAKLKLINDIYYNNKKVIGILCKNIISKKAVIIGIGMDLYKNEKLPLELSEIVGYLFDDKINEDEFAKNIIDGIYHIFRRQ